MELRSSAAADFAVFSRSTFLIDSGFLAPRKRRSAEGSRRYKYRIAVSICMTELACGMPPHVTIAIVFNICVKSNSVKLYTKIEYIKCIGALKIVFIGLPCRKLTI